MKPSTLFGVLSLAPTLAITAHAQSAGGVVGPTYRFGDFDRDGLADIYAVQPARADRLFKNLGDGSFADVSDAMGLSAVTGSRMALWQDFDGDGWLDLYVCAASGRSRLLRNESGASFIDVTVASGVAHHDGAELYAEWLDFDLDGWSDLHIVTEQGDRLYRNLNGRFTLSELGAGELGVPVTSVRVAQPNSSAPQALTVPASANNSGSTAPAPTNPGAGSGSGPSALTACVHSVQDVVTFGCLDASATPALGRLYPLTSNLNVNAGGNVGIGTTGQTEKLDVVGNVRASGQVSSTVSTGTPPLAVSSTTKVANLNADQLDGIDSSAFSQLGNSIESNEITDGAITSADLASDASSCAKVSGGVLRIQTGGNGNPSVVGGIAANAITDGAGGATIAGGGDANNAYWWNTVYDNCGTIAGGGGNQAGAADGNPFTQDFATVSGGLLNTASGAQSCVSGGYFNLASGYESCVPGGTGNVASGQCSLAAGRYAKAGHDGTFVWSDASPSAIFESTANNQFLIRAAGGVGIGTTSPGAPLHVMEGSAGSIPAHTDASLVLERSSNNYIDLLSPSANETGVLFGGQGNSNADGGVLYNSQPGSRGLSLRTAGATRVTVDSIGYVGIGANPGIERLTVAGGIVVDSSGANFGSAATSLRFGQFNSGEAIASKRTPGGDQWGLDFYTNYLDRMSILNNGNIGINTTIPQFTLEVNGSAGKPGGGAWSVASDARLKKNVHDLRDSLEKLMELRGVTFEYIDPKAVGELDGVRTGFIAQEVEKVVPDWVEEAPDGYKRLSIRGFEALAVEALREMRSEKDAQIAQLERELAKERRDSTERFDALSARLAALEGATTRR